MTAYPSIEQIKILHKLLLSTEAELMSLLKLSQLSADIVELDQSRVGRLSRMDAMQQQQMASAGKRRQQYQLLQISQALKKIAEDEYGYCIECGEEIAFARLQIRPESEICVACQNLQEQC
ncbi:MAG: DnaK suppressor protein [Enterobacterales bacterium]|jgi:DnaK suppressor protein